MLHAEKDTAEINVSNSVPLLFGNLRRGLDRVFDTGIVERKIQPPEGFDGRVQRLPYVLAPRHVASDGEGMSAEILDDAAVSSLPFSENISHYHARALAGKRHGGRAIDAVRRTGSKGDLAGEASFSVRINLLLLSLCRSIRP